MNKIIAIHQPNFFPWLGYFDKIIRSDGFIFLDDVQFPKKKGVWTNRVPLLISGESRWVTAAIDRNYHGLRNINEMHYLSKNPWRSKMIKTIDANYRKHPYFWEVFDIIEPLIQNQESNIAIYNINAVMKISLLLGVDKKKYFWSSQLDSKVGKSNELLSTLTLEAGGNTYMCGGGADGYQDEMIFNRHGLALRYQDFQHPVYQQKNATTFVPGLSILDAAFNLGWDGTRNLLVGNQIVNS